ncbi:MAG: pilus assembly protein TadG-related protein [Bauldia sp.]
MFTVILKTFLANNRGTVLPIFVLALLPLLLATGGVVDFTNAYDKQTMVQDAMDSAALAAGKKIGLLTMEELEVDVDNYYTANLEDKMVNPPPLTTAVEASTLTLTTVLSVPTYFLGMIGIDQISFNLTSQATLALGTLEVAIVLDNSGSMNTNDNIATLRTAAGDLATTLWGLGATSTEPDPVKIGLVPFAAAVNVGSAYQNDAAATWLDKTGLGTYNADIMDAAATTVNPFDLLANVDLPAGAPAGYNTWGGCVEARPIPYDASDDGASVATPATMFVPMFAPDEPDNWTCSTGTCFDVGSSGSNRRYLGAPSGNRSYNNYLPDVTATPATVNSSTDVFTSNGHGLTNGTQVEFQSTGSMPGSLSTDTVYYVISSGLTANNFKVSTWSGGSARNVTSNGSGLGFTKVPSWTCSNGNANCGGGGNGVAEETAMSATSKYGTSAAHVTPSNITVGGIPGGPNFMCTSKALQPLTVDQTTVTNAVNAMIALGATNIEEGLMWGWRVLSPSAPFTEGRAYTANDNQKILVFMTDGENTYYPTSKYPGTWYGAWGFISKNHLGTTSTDQDVEQNKMDERTAIACQAVKDAGITVYTVAFTGSGGINDTTQAMLVACATEPSMAYVAADQSALLAAFSAIGDDISLLRISQ